MFDISKTKVSASVFVKNVFSACMFEQLDQAKVKWQTLCKPEIGC